MKRTGRAYDKERHQQKVISSFMAARLMPGASEDQSRSDEPLTQLYNARRPRDLSVEVARLENLDLSSFDTSSMSNPACHAPDAAVKGSCVGAAATLPPFCNPRGENPASAFGALLLFGTVFAVSDEAPVVRLLSSVTTVPEPATWLLLVAGFAGLGGQLRDRRAKRPA